jgi:hypothetical protein
VLHYETRTTDDGITAERMKDLIDRGEVAAAVNMLCLHYNISWSEAIKRVDEAILNEAI